MKRLLGLLVWFATVPISPAADSEEAPPATSVQIVGAENGRLAITSGSTISVTFPTAVVPASEIDVEAKTSPLRFAPELQGKFMWKSQTEGEFTAGSVPPGVSFEIQLSEGLRDLSGNSVSAPAKLATGETLQFTVDSDFEAGNLPRRPSVPLRFSYVVAPADLASAAWFQDRDTRKRIAAEVVLPLNAETNVGSATVTPREDLPGGKTFDLVVEGLTDAGTRSKFPQLFVKPLGKTSALGVTKIAAFNYPLLPRRIAVEFTEPVDPAEGTKVLIEPKVAGVKCRARGNELWFEGDFDLAQRYQVTVPVAVTGKSGFAIASESRWGASFHAKKPAIIFPTEDLHQRSRLGLRFAFIQVNTGPLHWKLARVPPEKLLAVNRRLREFTNEQVNPVTGDVDVDPDTGWPRWTPTELLIDVARLEPVHEEDIPASQAEADTQREISWKPERGVPAGCYVLEVSGRNPSGKTIGNRALITFTEVAAVQKQFADTRLLRLMSVADGRSLAGVRVRAVSAKNEFVAESMTDRDGVAAFRKQALFPRANENEKRRAEWFLLETPDGPTLQKVDAEHYASSAYSSTDETMVAPPKYRLIVTTDRPLYRPGHTVKFKGYAREVDASASLRIPRATRVEWRITGEEHQELTQGTAKLDDYGGYEGEWKIPETVKTGQCELSVAIQDETAEAMINVQEFRPPPFTVALEDLKPGGGEAGIRIVSVYFHGAVNAGAKVHWEAIWNDRGTGESDLFVTDQPHLVADQLTRVQSVEGHGVLGPDGTLELKVAPPFKDGIPRGWFDVGWTVEVTAADGQTIEESVEFSVYTVPVRLQVSGAQVDTQNTGKLAISIKAGASAPDGHEVQGRSLAGEIYRVQTKTAKEVISPNVYRFRNTPTFEKCGAFSGKAPLETNADIPNVGEYLLAVRDTSDPRVPVATRRVYVAGPGEAEFPVADEQTLGITTDKPAEGEAAERSYIPGDTAVLSIQSPFAGVAWVSLEAGTLLDSFVIPVEGNSGRIEFPIKPEYAPNVWASVYLLRPGGE